MLESDIRNCKMLNPGMLLSNTKAHIGNSLAYVSATTSALEAVSLVRSEVERTALHCSGGMLGEKYNAELDRLIESAIDAVAVLRSELTKCPPSDMARALGV